MPKKIAFFLLTFILVLPSSVLAQETLLPTPTPLEALPLGSSSNPLEDWLRSFTEIPRKLSEMFKASVPLQVGQKSDDVSGSGGEEVRKNDATIHTAKGYDLYKAKATTDITYPETPNFISDAMDKVGAAFGMIGAVLRIGNQSAKDSLALKLPLGVEEKVLAQQKKEEEKGLAEAQIQNSPQVLGVEDLIGSLMLKSLPMIECSELPIEVGDCAKSNMLKEMPKTLPTITPTVTP